MTRRPTPEEVSARFSADAARLNPHVSAAQPRQMAQGRPQDTPARKVATGAGSGNRRALEPATCPPGRYGKCPHTGRPYRSRTEARWARESPAFRFEPLGIRTPCGVYWPDFVGVGGGGHPFLIEVKGGWIRDRAMHKVKAAIRPARALGFAGIWLAQWAGGKWTVTEVEEG
jgi:hypothetical protein